MTPNEIAWQSVNIAQGGDTIIAKEEIKCLVSEAILAERERCAKIAEIYADSEIAAAIRKGE